MQAVEPRCQLPAALVLTVTVAYPSAKAISAVATVVPFANFKSAVSFSPLLWLSWPPWPPSSSPGGADGDGEPVQIDGVVPGVELGVSGALQALNTRAGTAKQAATATVLSMCKSLAGD